jgi:FkbM family methyltransferase
MPIEYRQSIGLWTARQAGRSKYLLYPYFFILCGIIPKGIELLPAGDCKINYKDAEILSPRDGIFTSWEVLQDEIYEKFYIPKYGDVVVDIGAYVGMFTVKTSLRVGLGGSVIAIEPAKANIRYLERNTKSLANVTIVPVAVAAYCGDRKLSMSKASPCHTLIQKPGSSTELVKADTLDNILLELGVGKVDFIKIDAEGSELEILRGARNTLKNNKLRLAVAAYHNLSSGEHELPYISRLLASAGFRMNIVKEYIYAEN